MSQQRWQKSGLRRQRPRGTGNKVSRPPKASSPQGDHCRRNTLGLPASLTTQPESLPCVCRTIRQPPHRRTKGASKGHLGCNTQARLKYNRQSGRDSQMHLTTAAAVWSNHRHVTVQLVGQDAAVTTPALATPQEQCIPPRLCQRQLAGCGERVPKGLHRATKRWVWMRQAARLPQQGWPKAKALLDTPHS